MTESRTQPMVPEACSRPSRLFRLLTALCTRGRTDLSRVLVGARWPLPLIYNEAGEMDLGAVWLGAGTRLWSHKGGKLAIADGTVLDEGSEIIAWEEVRIGKNCYLGWNSLIMDSDLHAREGRPIRNRPVSLGDGVWIGCRAVVLKGVHIGTGATILPGAVVTRDVPAGTIYGAPPAEAKPPRPDTDKTSNGG